MNGSPSNGRFSSRRAVLAKAATGLAIGGGALAVVTAAGEQPALAATTDIPWLVQPSGDTTGAQDVTNVQSAVSTYGVAWLGPGTYYAASTITCNEGQYVCGPGREAATWNLVTTGIPAFQWTPAYPSSYSVDGMGGITGLTIANTVNPGGNPSDGSIGLQMGDIVSLECDVYIKSCEYGLLLENQYFWTERGDFSLSTYYCTNPVTFQVAASGGAGRTGSFDRTCLRWFANDNLVSGKNGISLLAGAQIVGGALEWSGNFGGSNSNTYSLYINGTIPSGTSGGTSSSLTGTELICSPETVSGSPMGTIYLGSDNYAEGCFGSLWFWDFAAGSINGGWWFDGPVQGDAVLATAGTFAGYGPSLSGATGAVYIGPIGAMGLAFLEAEVSIPSGTKLPPFTTIASGFAAQYTPAGQRNFMLVLWNGTELIPAPCGVTSSGDLQWIGAEYTTPAASALQGTAVYRTG